MRIYTVHLRPLAPPVLVPERFSWGALLFGPLWLAAYRAWVPAAIALAASLLILALASDATQAVLLAGLAVLLGQSGQDLRRWSLAQRGYRLVRVLAASNEDAALERLLNAQPDLIEAMAR